MKRALLLSLCLLCCALRAEFPPDDISSAIDPDNPEANESDNPFSAQPEELEDRRQRPLRPRTRSPVEAEEEEEVPEEPRKKRRPARSERDPDSAETSEDIDGLPDESRDRVAVRLGLYGGMNLLSSGDSNVTDQRSQEGLTTTFPIGLHATMHGFRYFGAELDGYYSFKPQQNVFSSSSASSSPASKTINVMGGDAIFKAVYPFDQQSFRWYPSIGLGYGYHALKTSSSTNGAVEEYNLTTSGFLAYVGIEMAPSRKFRLILDGSLSLMAAGLLSYQPAGGTPSDSGEAGRFLQARLSAFLDVSKHFSIGAMVIYRSLQVDTLTVGTATAPTAGAIGPVLDTPENQIQMLASIQYVL